MNRTLGIIAVLFVALAIGWPLIEQAPMEEGFEVDPSLPRVTMDPASSSLGMVVGAEWVDDHLYVLDPARSEVVVMEKGALGWTEVSAFGSEGSGPGEFQWPTDIVWLPDVGEFVILSSDRRAHRYSREGRHLRDEALQLPCALGRGSLARRSGGRYWVSGNCVLSGVQKDTMFAVVAGLDGKGGWSVFARKARFSLDGDFGTAFGAERPVAAGTSAAYLNAGNDLCFSVVPEDSEPVDDQPDRCLPGTRFETPEPDDFPSDPRYSGPAFSWPKPLPSVSAFGVSGEEIFLLRMYSADSVFLEAHPARGADSPGKQLAVGSMDHLIGCRHFGCLWFEPGISENRLGLLLFPELLQNTGRPAHGR
jgi:hypothetical protein